ncbi:MAG: exlusion protein FxsA, partial [Polycyclovorans sp.]|nr:exlusion protein FxsA [Polycyclovorans sp.]
GAMILVAGALLLTPGFFTDAIGFALLMPPVRRAAFDHLRRRVHVQRFEMGPDGPRNPKGPRRPRDPGVIEGDYHEVDPANSPKGPGTSGWTTRH